MEAAVALLSKAPIAGFCKTRLCSHITSEQGAELQRLFIQDLANTIMSIPMPLQIYYLAPDKMPDNKSRQIITNSLPRNIKFLSQQGSDLGARMYNASLNILTAYPAVIIVGSDLPQLGADIYKQVTEQLEQSDLVIGPSSDGGYYLLALKKNCPELFMDIIWSTAGVLEETLRKAKGLNLKTYLLSEKRDIDTYDDLLGFCAGKGYENLLSYQYAKTLL